MKRNIIITALSLLIVFCSYTLFNMNVSVANNINRAISMGMADGVAEYLASDLELSLYGRLNNCSREQATQVLHEFFRQNKPAEYSGVNNSNIVSGMLTTYDGKTYKVDYTLKTLNNKECIIGLYVY